MTNDLAEKILVVTGGGAGFGEAFCATFAELGARIAILDVDMKAASRVAERVTASGGRSLVLECDVANEAQVEQAMGKVVDAFGGVDVLINNAALHLRKYNQPFHQLTRDEHRALLDVNVMGVINCTLSARAGFAARGGGAVINISSIGSYYCATPYGVSKLAVRGLTMAFAKDLAPERVRVNCIAPGLMATPAALADQGEIVFRDFVENRQLIKRRGEIDDVVNAAVFLASSRSGFMTGETLKVSGGYPLAI